ncbi:hypothetical protein Hs20B_18300 [Lactococcus insecticola]|uniref:Fido domain-containing protein n=2 Tax=Pseudolactococcus insecticola TaxID=2709158 RepID=A0A6A0B814_9LACT|nr:hypothetical protein Hs20B_18300 [Lactococcus insecticola]
MYEVANHREALADLISFVATKNPLDSRFIKLLHADLLDHIREDKGAFKTQQNAILGATIDVAKPSEVPFLIDQWLENYNWQLKSIEDDFIFEAIARSHIEFEKIHPFSDGNGRVGRMLIDYGTLKQFGTLAVITIEQRNEYIGYLQDNNIDGLASLLEKSVAYELNREQAFVATEGAELSHKEDKKKGPTRGR